MKTDRTDQRIQPWAFSRHFWMHRRENLFVLGILTMGFLFYIVYGTWSAGTASTAAVDAEPLRLPSDVVAEVPYWMTGLDIPNPSTALSTGYLLTQTRRFWRETHQTLPSYFHAPVDLTEEVLQVPVLSAAGTVPAWGLPGPSSRVLDSFSLVEGRWPEKLGEFAVSASFAGKTGQAVGGGVTLQYIRIPEYRLEELTGRVVGVYDGTYDVMPQVVVLEQELQELTNIEKPNLYLAWGKEVEDIVVHRPPPGATTEVFHTPPLEELVGDGNAPMRMPVMLRYEPPGTLFPFGMVINDRVRVNGSTEQGLLPLFEGIAIRIWPLTLLIFLSQGIALTVVLAIVVVDRQKALGIYKVLGVDKGQLRRLYFFQLLIVGLAATLLGGLIFYALRPFLLVQLGLVLFIRPGTMLLWLFAILVFATWSGHVAASLFATTDIDSLLKAAFDFDWWSIVRFDLNSGAPGGGTTASASEASES